ncbi:MAG TPA: 4-hydroxy-tetrahydrodipicolinate synthase [Acidimicrobiales bacterium]|jgi:4-hydroxy-tetrahydrodipicolinate synthase|nr:4-hydroxy-tetrahydrodipicolinate synthase [Acidimicrobiales bacterium]
MARFGSVVTAMVTPFHSDGALDIDGAVVLADHLVQAGSDGLVVAGTTGEGPVLTDEEALELFRAVAGAVDVPVVASTGSNDTAHAVTFTQSVANSGVDGVLVVTPYYNRPSAAGLSAHFRTVAAATDLPVVLYDIPHRTGRRIGTDLVIELAHQVPNIVAVKDSTGDLAAAARVVAETPDSFEVYSGDDPLTLPFLAVGGVGIVSVAAHWAAGTMAEMVAAFNAGDLDRARAANQRLAESYAFESSELYPNPVPAKAACRAQGLPAGQCRLPNAEAPGSLDDDARGVIERLRQHASNRQSVA